ncbi:MAG: SagB/ThcOx family dehydrogenase [bacterium]
MEVLVLLMYLSQVNLDRKETIELPKPRYKSNISLEEALVKRRSIREYKNEPISLSEISQLLWATQGVTDKRGFRTAPSAGALYPLEVYVVVGLAKELGPGVYKYIPQAHRLIRISKIDKRKELCRVALNQSWVKDAPCVFVVSAIYERTTGKYGERGIRYVHIEAGHAVQNLHLQAISLGLGSVSIGAFYDEEVKGVIGMENMEQPLYIVPVGRPK